MSVTMKDEIEYLDVVDRNDVVINRLPYDQVHKQNLLHRAVHALIMATDGSTFVLQKRAANKRIEPNCWDSSVGGHVRAGETYLEAIQRECHEEMGIVISEEAALPLFKLDLEEGVGNEFVEVYLILTDDEVKPCPVEVAEVRRFTPEQVIDFISNEKEPCSITLQAIFYKMFQQQGLL